MRKHVSLDEAKAILEDGKAVILDTDTVPGIAVASNRPDALHVLYESKSRDSKKPIAWLVSSSSDLHLYGENVPDYAILLADAFWPGALTLIVRASDEVGKEFAAEDGTIGLRMPNDASCIALMKSLGYALATTSANASGTKTPSTSLEIHDDFAKDVPLLSVSSRGANSSIAANPITSQASTVIDCTGDKPCLIREGAIPFSDIEKVLDTKTGVDSCE